MGLGDGIVLVAGHYGAAGGGGRAFHSGIGGLNRSRSGNAAGDVDQAHGASVVNGHQSVAGILEVAFGCRFGGDEAVGHGTLLFISKAMELHGADELAVDDEALARCRREADGNVVAELV
ncbi:MAG: hypothetical protein NC131_19465, partial [Roseburia sp.]|nr:hypothetical protein [Roseburia sp.]